MRVIAGAAKGRRLIAPRGTKVRPTADRVKEALFASLQDVVVGARVLDLFSGSGALGLEALSRGALEVTFVERDESTLGVLRRNLVTVDLPGAHVVGRSVVSALAGALPGGPFDLVLADPPYRLSEQELLRVLEALPPHLDDGATVVLERASRDGSPRWPRPLRPASTRRYGDTSLHRAQYVPISATEEEEPM